ncbi:unnamed protein product [Cylindrotheca closterium]|uniref:Uncharacterized protein n=1 Tax=Cylindrotheca closterium TaxID=2856 RepID=A0AAD2G1Z3_9STRA|nr:unnamed protein product [Cylindrotheca closterium]
MPNTFKPIVNPYRKNKPINRPATGSSVPSTAAAPVKKQWNPQNKANVKVQGRPSSATKPVTPINRSNIRKTPSQQTPSGITPVVNANPIASTSPPVVRGLPKVTPTKRTTPIKPSMLKKKNSLKQQLKQELALLKRRKTLSSLQKEADERRRQKEKERAVKMKELQAMQEERQKMKDEKQRQRMEILKQKEEERIKKQQERGAERLRKQQEREKRLEEKRLKEYEMHVENCTAYQKYLLQCHQYQQKALQHRQEQQKYQAQYVQYTRMQAQVLMQAQMGMFRQHPMPQQGMMAAAGMMVARPTMVGNFMAPQQPVAGNWNACYQANNMVPQFSVAFPVAPSPSSGMITANPTPTGNSNPPQPLVGTGTNPSIQAADKLPRDSSAAPTVANESTNGSSMAAPVAAVHPPQPSIVAGNPQFPSRMSAFVRPPLQKVTTPHLLPPQFMQQMHPAYTSGPSYPAAAMGISPPVAPAPLPHPPVPPTGVQRIWKPWRQARPQAQPRPKPIEIARLCEVTKGPSPFAHYQLLEIKLVRPEDEKSFGVSLKLFQQSTLVDPEWYDEQIRKHLGLAAPTKTTSLVPAIAAAKTDDGSNISGVQNPPTPVNLSTAADQKESSGNSEEASKNGSNTDDKVQVENAAKAKSPKPAEAKNPSLPPGSSTQEEKQPEPQITAGGQSSGESTMGHSSLPTNLSNGPPLAKDSTTPDSAIEKSSTNPEGSTNLTEKEQPHSASTTPPTPEATTSVVLEQVKPTAISDRPSVVGDVKPTSDGSVPKASGSVTTAPTPIAVLSSSPAATAKSTRRRRRRVNFSVMLVVDTTKQNGYRDKAGPEYGTTLLQTGDIVVSIGGTSIANKTFAQACAVFASKSENSNGFISANLVVARRPKPAPKPLAPKLTSKLSSKIPKGQKPSNDPKGMVLANSNQPFQAYEFAAIADSIIRAIHQPSRLLGQHVSTLPAFEPMISMFQKIGTLKSFGFEEDQFPARSIPALQTQWIEQSRRMESELRVKHQAQWTKKIEAEGGFQDVTFSSDAQRSSLRQMPRPVRGCRCGREDHEYLHDPKCLLYRDICRLVPPNVLSGLLRTDKKVSKKKDAGLNTVEKGFKDRLVKLKAIAELEEQEANFVAHMEEVQVKQCKKAVFAPTALSSMILSAVFELQREFPTNFVHYDEDDSDSDDEEEEVTVSGDKRTAHSSKRPKNKRQKQNAAVPKMINFRYMLRMLQYISKTWGHVYREPSHEEFAWRWELFHGHHSSQGQWESQAKNPRTPNSLPFEMIQAGEIDVQSAADLTLLRSTVAEFYGSVGKEFDDVMKRIAAQKEAEKKAAMALSKPLTKEMRTTQSTTVNPPQASNAADPKIKADGSDFDMADAVTEMNVYKNTTKPTTMEGSKLMIVDPSAATTSNGVTSTKDLANTTNASTSPVEAASEDVKMVDSKGIATAKENIGPSPNAAATATSTAPSTLVPKVVSKNESNLLSSTNSTDSTATNTIFGSPAQTKNVNMSDVSTAVKVEEKKKPLPRFDVNQESADYFLMAAHLLYPSTSGLYDELMALLKMDVLKLDPSGIPGLAMDWYTNVDIVILEDLDRCFGSDADPEGRFCINDELRDTLEEKWVKLEYGWAMTDDSSDLVFEYDVIDAWREAFQGEMEEQANMVEGVGRYGL